MATIRTGEGSLYDADANELPSVAYLIEAEAELGEPIIAWSVRLTLPPDVADLALEPGRCLLEIEDGARAWIDLAPTGAAACGTLAFTGASVLPASIGSQPA